jgi:hypothetical protein
MNNTYNIHNHDVSKYMSFKIIFNYSVDIHISYINED